MSAPRGGTKWSCKHCLYEVPGVSPDFLFPYCPSCQEKQSETGSGNETSDDQKSPCSEGTTDSEVSSSGSASISPPPQSKRPNGVNNQQNQPDSLQRPPDSQQPDSHNQRPDIRQDHGASNQQGHKKQRAKAMDAELHEWQKSTRLEFYELNYYTTRQLLMLRKEFEAIKNSEVPSVSPSSLALLQSISSKITSEMVCDVVKCTSQCIPEANPIAGAGERSQELPMTSSPASRGLSMSNEIMASADLQSSARSSAAPIISDKPALTEDKKAIMDYIITRIQCSRTLVLKAFEECRGKAVDMDDYQQWCVEHLDEGDTDDKVIAPSSESESESDQEFTSPHGSTPKEMKRSPFQKGVPNTRIKAIQSTIQEREDSQPVDDFKMIRSHDDPSEIHADPTAEEKCLNLEQLGIVLKELSERSKGKAIIKRTLVQALKNGSPNLLVVQPDIILRKTLSLYMEDPHLPLPTPEEVLVCNPSTTAEEVNLFWMRAVYDPEHGRIFCLVNAEKLSDEVSESALQSLHELCKGKQGYRLVIICSNEEKSHFSSDPYLYKQTLELPKDDVFKKYIFSHFTCETLNNGISASVIHNDNKSCVHIFSSNQHELGRSLYIQHLSEKLKKQGQPGTHVTTPLHGHVGTPDTVLNLFKDHSTCCINHIDVVPDISWEMDITLFSLLVLHGLSDSQGRVWRCHPNQLYAFEVTLPNMDTIPEQDKKALQTLALLNLMPSVSSQESAPVMNTHYKIEVVVEFLSEKMENVTVECMSSDTIENIKMKIQKKMEKEIPFQKQHLFFDKQKLQDTQTLSHYKIENGHELHLLDYTPLFVEMDANPAITIEYNVDITIENIKSRIYDKIGILPDQQRLFLGEEQLKEGCDIKRYSILKLVCADIDVMIDEGKTLPLQFNSPDPTLVENLKYQIMENTGILIEKQRLVFDKKELKDGSKLSDYKIQIGATLHLDDLTQCYVRDINGKSIAFEYVPSDTIQKVKTKIQEKEGIPLDQQQLIFAKEGITPGQQRLRCELQEESLTLSDYGIPGGCRSLYLIIFPRKIYIKTSADKTITIECMHSDSIKEVKAKIKKIRKIPIEQQQLFYARKELEDGCTLSDYKIKYSSTLHFYKSGDFNSYLSSLPASAGSRLESTLDCEYEGVEEDLDFIAKHMDKKLLQLDQADIKECTTDSEISVYEKKVVLKKWSAKEGNSATYRNLLEICCEKDAPHTAAAICEVLRKIENESDEQEVTDFIRTIIETHAYDQTIKRRVAQSTFVGPPGSGKSSFINRLRGRPPKKKSTSTSRKIATVDLKQLKPSTLQAIDLDSWERMESGEKFTRQIKFSSGIHSVMKFGSEKCERELKRTSTLYLRDTGCLVEFQELLSLLIHGPSFVFFLFNVDISIEENFIIMYESINTYTSSITTEDALLQCLCTVHATGEDHLVFLVGTHIDELKEREGDAFDDKIKGLNQYLHSLLLKNGYRDLVQYCNADKDEVIFTVDNMSDNDQDFNCIRSKVAYFLNRGEFEVQYSLSYPLFCRDLLSRKKHVFTLKECRSMAAVYGITGEKVINLLCFLHSRIGIIQYFNVEGLNHLVIKEPQVLFKKVTDLIIETFSCPALKDTEKDVYKKRGIISKSCAEIVLNKMEIFKASEIENVVEAGEDITSDEFLKLLIYLRIIAPFHGSPLENKIFIPCILSHAKTNDMTKSTRILPLGITFERQHCPKGIFGTLVTHIITPESDIRNQYPDLKFQLKTKKIFKNQVSFSVSIGAEVDEVSIKVNSSHLEVNFFPDSSEDRDRPVGAVCCIVREILEKSIIKSSRDLHYDEKRVRPIMCLRCDSCKEFHEVKRGDDYYKMTCEKPEETVTKCIPSQGRFWYNEEQQQSFKSNIPEQQQSFKSNIPEQQQSFKSNIPRTTPLNTSDQLSSTGNEFHFISKMLSLEHRHKDFKGEGTRMAIIDYGFYPHQALKGVKGCQIYKDENELIRCDSLQRSTIADVYTQSTCYYSHATAVAGIAVGKQVYDNEGKYCLYPGGVAPEAELTMITIPPEITTVSKYLGVALKLIIDCDLNFDVVSISLHTHEQRSIEGSEFDDSATLFEQNEVRQYIRKLKDKGMIVIAAAGNKGDTTNDPEFPANFKEVVISIGSLNSYGKVSDFSKEKRTELFCYGEVHAPWFVHKNCVQQPCSEQQLPYESACQLEFLRGTSMAVPAIAGLICLMIQHARSCDEQYCRKNNISDNHDCEDALRHKDKLLKVFENPHIVKEPLNFFFLKDRSSILQLLNR